MIARQCCICSKVYGYHDVPEEGISHGLCSNEDGTDSPCVTAFLNYGGNDDIPTDLATAIS